MIVLSGGDIVLPDRILTNASLVIDEGRIAAIETTRSLPSGASVIDVRDAFVVPGFIDVHVHGIEGHDTTEVARLLDVPQGTVKSRLFLARQRLKEQLQWTQ